MIKKRSTINITAVTLLLLIVASSSSCIATNRTDLVKSGVVTIEQQRTSKAYIAWSSAYKEKGDLVITGVLRRKDRVGVPIKTHVDVIVMSADGTVMDKVSSSDAYVSRRMARSGYKSFERFEVRMANVPAKGSMIRLVSHSGMHN